MSVDAANKTADPCACAEPRPVQVAARMGAARTLCAGCGMPLRLRFP